MGGAQLSVGGLLIPERRVVCGVCVHKLSGEQATENDLKIRGVE
jgi:hypothetical protein